MIIQIFAISALVFSAYRNYIGPRDEVFFSYNSLKIESASVDKIESASVDKIESASVDKIESASVDKLVKGKLEHSLEIYEIMCIDCLFFDKITIWYGLEDKFNVVSHIRLFRTSPIIMSLTVKDL